jgi:hypothetical protein
MEGRGGEGRGGGQRKLEFMVIDLFLNCIYDRKDLP